ncbi:Prolyl endopeptidase [Phycisphaerae bacterium RAS1]|nr:Prolyl endopeptidase [Phycisphaerae bacterium RAS1]
MLLNRPLIRSSALALLVVAASVACAGGRIAYPVAKRVDCMEKLHGQKIADPFRWMEDLDSPDVKAWVDAENAITFGWLEQIPARNAIKERMTKLWNYERYGTPFKRGNRYFYSRNDGLQNQSVTYVADSLDAPPRVLLDPNTLSADGTVALSGMSITDDGKLMAYGLSAAGSDWVEYKIRDVETGKDLPDHLKWIKFSGASWTLDGKGLFYSRYDEPADGKLESTNYFQKLFFHKLGTPQSEDKLIYERPDEKEWGFSGNVSDDGRYLTVYIWQGTEPKNRLYYLDLGNPKAPIAKLLDQFDAQYNVIDNDGPLFWIQTDLDAPRGRVIAIDVTKPDKANWKEIIPQAEETLQGVGCVGNTFFATYLKDACTQIKAFDLTGKFLRNVELPGLGSAGGFGGKRNETETFYSYTSFNAPPTIYRYDVPSGKSTVFKQAKVDFNPADYEVKQVFYNSKDGTKIPMFICHRKGIKLDGMNPTYLYGYGGFNASMTPGFGVTNLVWMEMGGIYAQACIRGGGEYGKAWHDAGRLKNKQNVFDDFIAAAEWLIANKYTSTPKLSIGGGSNGGLLVGACITQRPELFGAALPAVGVMDMLRFHKFTIGWAWTSDYGSPDDPEMFKVLHAYSPLHNIKPARPYPATLITTADHDDRVVPSHSFKFAATLQAAHSGEAPILIRIETRAGHGAGKPTTKIIEEAADKWAFLVRALDMDVKAWMSGSGGHAAR